MIIGEVVVVIGMIEFNVGSDLVVLCIIVVKEGDYYILNGFKVFIINGIYVDLVIVCVKMDFKVGVKGIFLFLVDIVLFGYFMGKKIEKIG